MAKFKKGDKVCINPNATNDDFDENACPRKYMKRKGEELIIGTISNGRYKSREHTYKIDGWWVLERCLLPYKEENEI